MEEAAGGDAVRAALVEKARSFIEPFRARAGEAEKNG